MKFQFAVSLFCPLAVMAGTVRSPNSINSESFLEETEQLDLYKQANERFIKNEKAVGDLEAFRSGTKVMSSEESLKGMGLDGKPIFTKMVEGDIPIKALIDEPDFIVILNDKAPYRELNAGNPDNAGMSFVHMLCLPKKRIYNAAEFIVGDQDTCRFLK
jgi:hypothetical protein